MTHRIHIPYGDPYYTPLIQQKKQKVGIMLKNNGQAWYDIIKSTRQFSPKPTTTTTTCKSTPPLLVNNRLDRQRRRNQLLSQHYGSNQHHYQKKNDTKKQRKQFDEEEDEDAESDNNSSTTTSSSSSSCSTVTSPVPTTMIQRRRRGNLPKTVTAVLKQWLVDHCRNPYPTEAEKTGLKDKTGLTLNQISNWFINARRRLLPQIIDTMLPQYKDNNALEEEDDNDDEESLREPIPRTARRKRRSTKDDYLYAHGEGNNSISLDANVDRYSCLYMIRCSPITIQSLFFFFISSSSYNCYKKT